jgi:hypothetical protein
MVVFQSLKKVPGLLTSQPVLLVPILLLNLLTAVQTVTQQAFPLIGAVVSLGVSGLLFFLTPLFHGGTIGMTNEAATSVRTSLGSFVRHGKQYYLSLLAAYLLLFAIIVALLMAGGFVGVVVALIYTAVSQSLAVLAVGGLIGLLLVGSYIVVTVLLQFYGHAIVIEDLSAVEGLKRSAGVVRENIAAVVGYFLVMLVGAVFAIGLYFGALWLSPIPFVENLTATDPAAAALPLDLVALQGLITVVILSPVSAIYLVYSVVFYRSLIGEDGSNTVSPAQPTDTEVGSSL